jgi:hypothetical protein
MNWLSRMLPWSDWGSPGSARTGIRARGWLVHDGSFVALWAWKCGSDRSIIPVRVVCGRSAGAWPFGNRFSTSIPGTVPGCFPGLFSALRRQTESPELQPPLLNADKSTVSKTRPFVVLPRRARVFGCFRAWCFHRSSCWTCLKSHRPSGS